MPDMDGYALTEAIRAQERGSRIPILALTANALKGESDRCRAAGMDSYLSKPLQLGDLKAALEAWLPAMGSSMHAAHRVRAADSPVPDSAPAIDVSVLESLIGLDPAVILEFLLDFQISTAKIAMALKSAHADGHPVRVSQQAHKLKSSARSVGALALGELCEQIETAGKAGNTETLTILLPLFALELDAVDDFLDGLQALSADRQQDATMTTPDLANKAAQGMN
jgi:HPt (histidine-containing phosphotransfer) domain-containing protein